MQVAGYKREKPAFGGAHVQTGLEMESTWIKDARHVNINKYMGFYVHIYKYVYIYIYIYK